MTGRNVHNCLLSCILTFMTILYSTDILLSLWTKAIVRDSRQGASNLTLTPYDTPAPYLLAAMTETVYRPALLIVDVQEDFCPPVHHFLNSSGSMH